MDLLLLSQNIRTLRQKQGLTLDQLAVKSGFSKGFLSQVENFRITPSVKALAKLSEVLGVPVEKLFQQGNPAPEYSFGRLSEGEEIFRNDNLLYGIRYHALAFQQIGRKVDPFIIEYTPAEKDRGFLMHDSEEFCLLLEGTLDFYILDDANVRRMVPGDTLYMRANLPHRVRLPENCSSAKALIVYSEGTGRKKQRD